MKTKQYSQAYTMGTVNKSSETRELLLKPTLQRWLLSMDGGLQGVAAKSILMRHKL